MTNQEAIDRIERHMFHHRGEERRAIYITEALQMAIEALNAQDAKWISCNDMLPKAAGCLCLVSAVSKLGGQSVFIAFTGYGDFKWHTSDKTYLSMHGGPYNTEISEAWTITHWMPLPAPPSIVTSAAYPADLMEHRYSGLITED